MAEKSTFNDSDIMDFEAALGLQPLEISDLHAIFWKAGMQKARGKFYTKKQKDYLFNQIYHNYMLRGELRNYVIGYKKENKQPIGDIYEAKTKKTMKITESQLRKMIKEAVEKAISQNNDTFSPEDQQLLRQFETTLTPQFLANLLEKEGALDNYQGELEDGWFDDGYDDEFGRQTGHYEEFYTPFTWKGEDYDTIIEFNGVNYDLSISFNLNRCKYDEDGYLISYDIDVDCVIINGEEGYNINDQDYSELYYHDFKTGEKLFKDKDISR